MKNLLFVSALLMTMISCNSVEQYRAPIEALTTEWSKAGEAVMNIAGSVDGSVTFMNTFVDSFKIDSTKKWSKNALMTMDSMRVAFTAQHNGVTGLASEIAEFKTKWTTMTADVDALTTGLKNGKLEGDVMVKINDLTTNAQLAMTQTEGWNKKVMAAQTTVVNAWDLFKKAAEAK